MFTYVSVWITWHYEHVDRHVLKWCYFIFFTKVVFLTVSSPCLIWSTQQKSSSIFYLFYLRSFFEDFSFSLFSLNLDRLLCRIWCYYFCPTESRVCPSTQLPLLPWFMCTFKTFTISTVKFSQFCFYLINYLPHPCLPTYRPLLLFQPWYVLSDGILPFVV